MRPLPYNPPGDWVDDAECRFYKDSDNVFFPPDDRPVARDFYRKAKEVCSQCNVAADCLDYGRDEEYGVWGGTTPMERQSMRRRRVG